MTALSQEFEHEVAKKIKNIFPICGGAVDSYWSLIWSLMQDSPGIVRLYTEAYCFEAVKTGQWQVWAYSDSEIRGIVVTRINIFPKCKILDVMVISGISGFQFMPELDGVFEILGRQQGCTWISVCVSPALERIVVRKFRGEKSYSVITRPVGLLARSS